MPRPGDIYPTTRPSLLRSAQSPSESREAIRELCCRYEPAIRLLMQRSGGGFLEQPADLTQEFLVSLLASGVDTYDFTRSVRFRTWLRGAVRHFLSNRRRREKAARRDVRRTGSYEQLPAATRHAVEPRDELTPERLYSSTLLACAVQAAWEQTREQYRERGELARFDALEVFVPAAELADGGYAAVAAQLGLQVGAVRKAVHDMRARFRECLRAHVRQLVPSDYEVDDELRWLLDAVATNGSSEVLT